MPGPIPTVPEQDMLFPNIGRAMDAAWAADIPVLVVQHAAPPGSPILVEGTPGWRHPDIARRPHDHRFEKASASSFAGTGLAEWLAARAIAVLVLVSAGAPAQAAPPTVFAPGVISGPAHDSAPAFTPDGSYLVFVSNRPATTGGAVLDGYFNGKPHPGGGGNLWRVDRRGDAWGPPVRLPSVINRTTSTFAPAVVRDGSVYFMEPASDGHFGLFRAQHDVHGYQPAVRVAFSDPKGTDVDPAVAPDESYAVFSSSRSPAASLDLFLVRRTRDGHWGSPVHLGPEVTDGTDAESRLSPDGRTLYFSSARVVPVTFPRTRADAARDLDRLSWDNTLYNIWQTDLSPWLDAKP